MEEEMLACLQKGGGVVLAKVKSARERKRLKKVLRAFGAEQSELGIWKIAPQTFGAALPPLAPSAQEESAAIAEEEEDYGPSPLDSTNALKRAKVMTQPVADSAAAAAPKRAAWMTSELQATDPKLLLRHKAQTSQKSRAFSNNKTSASGEAAVDTREVATGKQSTLAGVNTREEEQEQPFSWNHAEMMGTGRDVDTARLRNELQGGIGSRFTQSKKFL